MAQNNMRKALFPAIAVFALVMLPWNQAFASWQEDGNLICPAAHAVADLASTPDGTGGAIIAWADIRSGGSGSQIYVQRVSPSGIVLWTADGVPLCTAALFQPYPKIVSDDAGGAIVTWGDRRLATLDVYAQRVSASGTVLWNANGVPLCEATGDQFSPEIAADGAGGAIVTWYDRRSGPLRVYAQRVDAGGTVQWTNDGIPLCTGTGDQQHPTITSDDAGGAIVTWEDYRDDTEYDIVAQRVSSSGVVLWSADGVPVCAATASQHNPQITADGVGGAVVAWEDGRGGSVYIGVQRVSASGVVQWTNDGVRLCTAAGNQTWPKIVADGTGGAIVEWQDARSGHFNLYAQRVDGSGTVLWTATGAPLCTAPGDQGWPAMDSDGAGGAIVTWQDNRSGTPNPDIYAQRVNASGRVLWTCDGLALCRNAALQAVPEIASDGSGGAIIVWMDERNSASTCQLYAQRAHPGNCDSPSWPDNGSEVSTAPYGQRYPQIIADGSGGAIMTWQDNRTTADWDLYGQRMDASGCALWALGGAAISTALHDQSFQQLTADGSGGAIVTWEDYRSGNPRAEIYVQHVDSLGCLTWGADGSPVCTSGGNRPYVVPDGAGGGIVAWVDYRSSSLPDIYAQRVGAAGGALLWQTGGVPICTEAGTQDVMRIASDGAGGAIIVWEDNRAGNYDIYAQRVNALGVVQWTAGGVPLSAAAWGQRYPQIIADGLGGAIVTWQDSRATVEWDLYVQRIDGSGNVMWPANGIALCAALHDQTFQQLVSDGAGGAIVAWEDYRNNTDYNIYAQRVNALGSIQWMADGVPLCTAAFWQRYPKVVSDESGGALIVWQDNRTTADWDLYAQRVDGSGNIKWPTDGLALCKAVQDQANHQLAPTEGGGAILGWEDYRSGSNYDIYAGHLTIWGTTAGAPFIPVAGGILSQNEPNPFSPRTRITFSVGVGGGVRLGIYDVAGRAVRTLLDGWRAPGEHGEMWDGRRDDGTAAAPGVYFYRIETGGITAARKMVLLK
jgi:hypothetical protein